MFLIALLVVLGSLALGISIASRFGFAGNPYFRLAVGIPVGITVFSYALIAIYFASGITDTYITLLVVLASFAVAYAAVGKNVASIWSGRKSMLPRGVLWPILIVFSILFVFWFTSMYESGGALYCRNNAACSDLLYHFGIGNSLLYHKPLPPYLFSINTTNIFPFVFDLYSSLLLKLGFSMFYANMVPDILLLFSAVYLSGMLAYKMTGSRVATASALLIFWFGTNYAVALAAYLVAPHLGLPSFLPQPGSALADNGMSAQTRLGAVLSLSGGFVTLWIPILNPILMPQRDFLLGLALGLLAIYMVYDIAFEKRDTTAGDFLLLGSVVGLMPMVHPPTGIVLLFVILFSAIYLMLEKGGKKILRKSGIAVVPAVAFGSIELYYISLQKLPPGWYHFVYSSRIFGGQNIVLTIINTMLANLAFLAEVFGIAFILAVLALLLIGNRKQRIFSIPFLAMLVFAMVFSTQPVWTDNDRITLYVFLLFAVLGGLLIDKVWRMRGRLPKALACLMVVLISGNSIIIYINSTIMYSGYWLLTQQELDAAQFISAYTPQNAIFAVSNYNNLQNQPVSTVAARQTILSEAPYVDLEIHSLPISGLLDLQNRIFSNGDCKAIRDYNISYIYLESGNQNDRKPFENANFSEVFSTFDRYFERNITIYRAMC
ncbi:MAG: hypothetical protein KGH50_01045 [Candidatus Micrarchaeota archaeon]|nr:hypothetical protein [Candidatus Micrarchaeota archaeon]